MYRQTLTRAVRPAVRSFTTTSRAMAGGDTGAPRSTAQGQQASKQANGIQNSDAFTKREKANEDYAIRIREKEKLLELRKKIAEQHDHLKKLEEHIDEISKSSGGEQK
ncbi:ATPase inhibitor, mitochondrial [Lachnellula willkommii]|uniref:ATPase inhibitor, mitochondrial n=1 Tax=Lachnellula willkommii TaxID=215461 RepID=A0A559M755_9HELO|nr:ATPase inhibitor, mitochondrial [Lachnellula willkommii]